ncbi:SGNH/GDSL hydrolase family protein [Paenibacillus sp. HWE-109]|uniref:SGNH/GDSL hydrolase family protein n=1 Tax=Paenibacillus sp. HWE-109 TaxID=1306526 RepID=UPI001EE05A0F|nr:SGNH/GDSL hydrolase family protein [Paenibacillus sp. HWE-109]UKS30162.1 SGNH/GDSL hydrolase family protein [Paenibacillus sp. HWE-109]
MWQRKPTSNPSGTTSVQPSSTNGKIKVNGADIIVYDDTQVRNLITSNNADPSYMKYSGKRVFCFGDSITQSVGAANNYPTHLSTKLNANVTNFGSSGGDHNRFRCIVCGGTSNGGLTFTAPDFTIADVVTLTIGHNGGVGSSTMNDISGINDFNLYPDTYYGNFCRSIEYILNQNQNVKIYLMTPIQSLNASYITNTAASTTAIKIIGAKYALPVIDLQNTSGLNFRNLSLFTGDGTHPNPTGALKIAEVVYRQMLSY